MSSVAHEVSGGGRSHTASEDTIVYYTYVLESVKRPGTRYIGRTSDLRRRLGQHTSRSFQSASCRPARPLRTCTGSPVPGPKTGAWSRDVVSVARIWRTKR